MAHQVFVGVAEDVVSLRPVARKIQRRVLENGDQVGERVLLLLARAELAAVVEIREAAELVGCGERRNDLLVDLVADVRAPLQGHHVREAGPRRHLDRAVGLPGVLVRDVLYEQDREDVVLVLGSVHAPAQHVAPLPDAAVNFRLLDRHDTPDRLSVVRRDASRSAGGRCKITVYAEAQAWGAPSKQLTSRVVDEQLSVADVMGEHGVAGVASLRPDLERRYTRLHGAGSEASP